MRRWVVAGDVVASRRYLDRHRLLAGLDASLDRVNQHVEAIQPLTRGEDDVFTGTFAARGEVLRAVVQLRIVTDDLVLATASGEQQPVDVRVGIVRAAGNDATDAGSRDEALRALQLAEQLPSRPTWPPSMRTAVVGDGDEVPLMQAHLLLQDQLLARMDARDRRALLGLLDGERQVDIAAALGVTQPAIAKRVRDRGALAIMRSMRVLAGTEPDVPTAEARSGP